ncbi:MAG: hypothetical protein HOH33_01835, partial [Verrucomicrobia bacterium]|nr:hypothetical protein [Verrucomicrobiota bacterium]
EKYDLTRLEPSKGKANSGFCLSNDKDLFVYLVPKENDIIIPRLPREGFTRLGITWFDPFTGTYQEQAPIVMEQWNRIRIPDPGQMKVMVIRMLP